MSSFFGCVYLCIIVVRLATFFSSSSSSSTERTVVRYRRAHSNTQVDDKNILDGTVVAGPIEHEKCVYHIIMIVILLYFCCCCGVVVLC